MSNQANIYIIIIESTESLQQNQCLINFAESRCHSVVKMHFAFKSFKIANYSESKHNRNDRVIDILHLYLTKNKRINGSVEREERFLIRLSDCYLELLLMRLNLIFIA